MADGSESDSFHPLAARCLKFIERRLYFPRNALLHNLVVYGGHRLREILIPLPLSHLARLHVRASPNIEARLGTAGHSHC